METREGKTLAGKLMNRLSTIEWVNGIQDKPLKQYDNNFNDPDNPDSTMTYAYTGNNATRTEIMSDGNKIIMTTKYNDVVTSACFKGDCKKNNGRTAVNDWIERTTEFTLNGKKYKSTVTRKIEYMPKSNYIKKETFTSKGGLTNSNYSTYTTYEYK